ncbi:hypothetical protein [Nostoc sp. ChiQUE01b]|uniref:hypothetical protein n=1 Tax=Nostoc sp. ChiQUE01b TaxID=3075376 RepID=UPI002AD253AA|nr:hypothetical protein [Nostoc sp. ChiQUE01b]MDZ8257708.1 hypothetical protein [Nostoc sp. ChiQUE01b]
MPKSQGFCRIKKTEFLILDKVELQTCLEISTEEYFMIFLLNPQVITSDGECEAWFFDSKYGDAQRYPSFGQMMEEILNDPEFLG